MRLRIIVYFIYYKSHNSQLYSLKVKLEKIS
jgi:hypothetical protein